MHGAPAVTYPVGRSRFHLVVIGLALLFGVLAGLSWHRQADLSPWRQWVFGLSLLGTSVVAAAAWSRGKSGTLCWDGESWRWATRNVSICGQLAVHLDWQSGLLVSLRPERGQRVWLWPQRSSDAALWNALRRAVFSDAAAAQARHLSRSSRGPAR